MSEQDTSFRDGWMRYWGTFSRPLPVVCGFTAGVIVSRAIANLLIAIWNAL